MDMIGKVRLLHRRGMKSVREIARLTGLSRNTIDKWLVAPLQGVAKYRRGLQHLGADCGGTGGVFVERLL